MIIGERREEVIANIKRSADMLDFHAKVEINDPVLTDEEGVAIAKSYMQNRGKISFRLKSRAARCFADIGGGILNRNTEIRGLEKLSGIRGGAIITSNHFSPLDNTVIRKLAGRLRKKRINIVSQITNFAMTGPIGFLMNYADTIPLCDDFRYMSHELMDVLGELLEKDELVLIYPEREMWFNYRKPRPGLRGAYYFAAKLGVPVISCFVEMRDLDKKDTESFRKVGYTLHILDVLYPDSGKGVRENSVFLLESDNRLKSSAYERIYGKKLDYSFEPSDIAGWIAE